MTPRVILGDVTGIGKTVQVLRLLVYLIRRGEITLDAPAFVVVPAKALRMTWEQDGFQVFTPQVPVAVLDGQVSPRDRRTIYSMRQHLVYALNYNVFQRDAEHLMATFPHRSLLAVDEAHEIRHHSTRSAKVVKAFATGMPRVIPMTASAINTALEDIHSPLESLGLTHVFGTLDDFRREYTNTYVTDRYIRGRRIKVRVRDEHVPYRNLDRLKKLIWPYYFRRNFADLPPGSMPAFEHEVQPIALLTRQREVYEGLRRRQLPPPGPGRRFKLQAIAQYLSQVCTGLQTLQPTAPDISAKLDWLMRELQADLSEGGYYQEPDGTWQRGGPTKVVVFSAYKATIVTLIARLRAVGIGHVVMAGTGDLPDGSEFPWGTSPSQRGPLREKFFRDPQCQVLIGTRAIDASLNLQAAPLLVNVDLLPNPAAMEQLFGRIIRENSPWDFVRAVSLVCTGTIEEGRLRTLAKRQELINLMNDEEGVVYSALTENELEDLILHRW